MNLTIEQQRKLTEFLGECWHEPTETPNEVSCDKCGTVVYDPRHVDEAFQRLDFTDRRVVGRLIEKVGKITIDMGAGYVYIGAGEYASEPLIWLDDKTPQEAICRSVLAWLEENHK
jgi:hypothetical protein